MTTTPTERVQRLRALLAEATPAPWEQELIEYRGAFEGESTWELVHPMTQPSGWLAHPLNVIKVNEDGWQPKRADAALIVRLRNAAEEQLDHLAGVFERHFEYYSSVSGANCDRCFSPWPCADYRAALAVLDILDPEGADT